MQDEVREKSVALVIKVGKGGAKLTAALLKLAIRDYLKHKNEPVHGKQSVKSLAGKSGGLQSIEITDRNIKSFEKVARKYGIDFALKKAPQKGQYIVFFRARDADALNAAFAEYTARTLKQQQKPSLLKQLAKFKQMVQQMAPGKEKNRSKGGMEH